MSEIQRQIVVDASIYTDYPKEKEKLEALIKSLTKSLELRFRTANFQDGNIDFEELEEKDKLTTCFTNIKKDGRKGLLLVNITNWTQFSDKFDGIPHLVVCETKEKGFTLSTTKDGSSVTMCRLTRRCSKSG